MEPIVSKVPFIKQGCMDSDDSTIESLNDGGGDGKSTDGNHGSCDVVHRSSSNNNKDSGDDDVSRKDISRQGGNDGIERKLRDSDIVDKSFRNPDVCRNKGGMDGYVSHMSGTGEFGLNLHRDNPLHMPASLTLAGRRYDQPQVKSHSRAVNLPERRIHRDIVACRGQYSISRLIGFDNGAGRKNSGSAFRCRAYFMISNADILRGNPLHI